MLKANKFILSVLIAGWALAQPAFAEILLFEKENCPYCTELEKYMEVNEVRSSLNISTFFIENRINMDLYKQETTKVGYNQTKVPLLIDKDTYKVGSKEIISYFESILKQKQEDSLKNLDDKEENELKALISGKEIDMEKPKAGYSMILIAIFALVMAAGGIVWFKKRK